MTDVIKGHKYRSVPIQGQPIGVGPGSGLVPIPPTYPDCRTLTGADSVTAVAYDKVLNIYAVANGTWIDFFKPVGTTFAVVR